MLTIQRILHATDFSATANTAFQYAARLAHKLKIPLDVLHVVPGMGIVHFEEISLSSDERALDMIHQTTLGGFRELAKSGIPEGVSVRYLIGRGPLPGPVILEEASHADSNIIVLGAQGEQSGEPPFLGSVAAELMQRSTCPVLMVPSAASQEAVDEKIETVLTFVSFSHMLQPVLKFALLLARLFGARLDVLALTAGKTADGEEDREAARNLEQQLWRVLASQNEGDGNVPGGNIRLHLQSTADVESIVGFAREHRSDLFIVESPGLGPIESPTERMLESIVNRSPCPVMLVNTCGKGFGRASVQRPRTRRLKNSIA